MCCRIARNTCLPERAGRLCQGGQQVCLTSFVFKVTALLVAYTNFPSCLHTVTNTARPQPPPQLQSLHQNYVSSVTILHDIYFCCCCSIVFKCMCLLVCMLVVVWACTCAWQRTGGPYHVCVCTALPQPYLRTTTHTSWASHPTPLLLRHALTPSPPTHPPTHPHHARRGCVVFLPPPRRCHH